MGFAGNSCTWTQKYVKKDGFLGNFERYWAIIVDVVRVQVGFLCDDGPVLIAARGELERAAHKQF